MGRFVPYGIEINGTAIGGITEQSIASGVEINSEVTAGATAPQFGEVNQIGSVGSFTSHDIPAVLGLTGSKGICLSGAGFALHQIDKEDCGSLNSGDVHRKVSIGRGYVVPRTLTAQQGQRATISCEILAIFDGTNKPVTVATGQALPTGITDSIGLHLGDAQLAGTAITRKTSLNIDFGVAIEAEFDDGESYPKSLQVNSNQPKLTIATHDVAKFGDAVIPLEGVKGEHSNTFVMLRRRKLATGDFETGGVHTKISAHGLVTADNITSASNNTPHSMNVMVTALDDTNNDMLIMSFTETLPT
ncbi:MAG: hypothetical protein AAF539_13150 [Planctomycetota bacterium]